MKTEGWEIRRRKETGKQEDRSWLRVEVDGRIVQLSFNGQELAHDTLAC